MTAAQKIGETGSRADGVALYFGIRRFEDSTDVPKSSSCVARFIRYRGWYAPYRQNENSPGAHIGFPGRGQSAEMLKDTRPRSI
jgi:hypothetical protein